VQAKTIPQKTTKAVFAEINSDKVMQHNAVLKCCDSGHENYKEYT